MTYLSILLAVACAYLLVNGSWRDRKCATKLDEAQADIRGLKASLAIWEGAHRIEFNRAREYEAKYRALRKAVVACRDCNDNGEEYGSPTADGATALGNLFDMVDE